jgi:hypothetical protein
MKAVLAAGSVACTDHVQVHFKRCNAAALWFGGLDCVHSAGPCTFAAVDT